MLDNSTIIVLHLPVISQGWIVVAPLAAAAFILLLGFIRRNVA